MSKDIILEIIIFILLAVIFFCVSRIRRLKRMLAQEVEKRAIPSLIVEFDPQDLVLYLKNDGACTVRDVRIPDVDMNIDVGFPKVLRLLFEPVETILPGKAHKLTYRLLEKDQALPASVIERMSGYFLSATFSCQVSCRNSYGVEFELEMAKTKDGFVLNDVYPAKQDTA